MVSKIFIFDIDGTLTNPRAEITPHHHKRFSEIMKDQIYFFVGGSDRDKIKEQVTWSIFREAFGVFACMGNEYWERAKLVSRHTATFDQELFDELDKILENSSFKVRTGNHVEIRPGGTVNFSIVGRNASNGQRLLYAAYDEQTSERNKLVEDLSILYPRYEFSAGGQISIDITERGRNKGQVLKFIREVLKLNTPIYFFGDKVTDFGNDGPLAEELDLERFSMNIPNVWHNVASPEHTLTLLEQIIRGENDLS